MTTIAQRRRNFEFYHRLKDGDPSREGLRGSPLHHFVFSVDIEAAGVAYGPDGTLTFRLPPDSDCYHRLLNCICDALPASCDADETLERVRALAEEVKSTRLSGEDWFPLDRLFAILDAKEGRW